MHKTILSTGLFVAALILSGFGSLQSAAQTVTSVPLASGTPVNAELASSLDSKKAKAGDLVNARVSEAVKADGAVVIPKGAKLVGHLTQASARSKGDSDSSLAIQFDKAILKNGQEVPVSLWIRAMAAEPHASFEPGPEQNLNAGTPAAGQSPMGSGRSPVGSATPTRDTIPDATTASGDSGNSGKAKLGDSSGLNASGQLNPNSSGVFGIEGVHLATDASSASQGSLITSSGKNVHLDSGTRLLLIAQEGPATSTK